MINTTETSPQASAINLGDANNAGHSMRLQLALNVSNLDQAVDFYSKMFDAEPAKRRPGYANFAIADPPLKLVLFETGEDGTINHLGVETSTADQVIAAEARFGQAGIDTSGVDDTACCFAEKTETWIEGPDATRWEWYVRTGESDTLANVILDSRSEGAADSPCAEGSCC